MYGIGIDRFPFGNQSADGYPDLLLLSFTENEHNYEFLGFRVVISPFNDRRLGKCYFPVLGSGCIIENVSLCVVVEFDGFDIVPVLEQNPIQGVADGADHFREGIPGSVREVCVRKMTVIRLPVIVTPYDTGKFLVPLYPVGESDVIRRIGPSVPDNFLDITGSTANFINHALNDVDGVLDFVNLFLKVFVCGGSCRGLRGEFIHDDGVRFGPC